jgi:hypothetical protein
MDVPAWLMIVTTIGGILGGTFGAWLLQVYKERNTTKLASQKQAAELKTQGTVAEAELRLKDSDQAFKIYKEIVDGMKRDMLDLQKHMEVAEKAHIDCREENATLRADVRIVHHELEIVREKLGLKPSSIPLKMDTLITKDSHNDVVQPVPDASNVTVKFGQ